MIKKTQTSQFMKLICWLIFNLSRSCQNFESCGTVIIFFLLHIFLHNIHNTCKQQIYCHIFTNMFGMNTSNCNCTPKGAYNVQVLYYISLIIAKGFLSATLLNNDPLVPIRNPCQAKIIQVLQAINIMLFLAYTHKLQMIFPVQIINVVT